jgi:GAF domain-containing protein
VFEKDVPWTIVKERKSGFYSNVREHEFLMGEVDRPGETPRKRFIEREGIESMAALLLPFRAAEDENEEVVGVMFANYRIRHDFNIDESSALATFADYAAAAILNARHEEQRRTQQLKMVESFSANLAHRMSHLVGPGRASAQLVKQRLPPTDEVSLRALDRIEREINLLFELSGSAKGF